MLVRRLALACLCACALLPGARADTGQAEAGGAPPPNILIILADDVGVDRIGAYAEHPDPGRTPVIDALADDGVLFRNAWAQPSCSPGRAAVLTGRHAFRTGIGRALALSPLFTDPFGLPLAETTLAELLAPTHEAWAIGKWHLAVDDDPFSDPLDQGFATHRGSFANLSNTATGDQYTNWEKFVDGVPAQTTTYATTDSVDEAIALIQGADGPWFLWLALNTPHGPFHKPPAALHTYDLPDDVAANIPIHAQAMIEAMDTELGRLFAAMGPTRLDETLVVFTADNGTANVATTPPFNPEHAKSTLYEGGLNVPLIVAGPGVEVGAECRGLVQLSDLYATCAEVAGVPLLGGDDSLSLAPYFSDPGQRSLRPSVYAETFSPIGLGPYGYWEQATRDGRYKLLRFLDAPVSAPDHEQLYDLWNDPFEQTDLLAGGPLSAPEELALQGLRAAADDLLGPWKQAGDGLAGVQGLPSLEATGTLQGGDPVGIALDSGAPFATAFIVLGLSPLYVPFKGGLFVPAPATFLIVPLDAAGAVAFGFSWPTGIPAGFDTWWQAWIPDAAGPVGFSASNAVVGTTP